MKAVRILAVVLLVSVGLVAAPAVAADPVMEEAFRAIQADDYARAVKLLRPKAEEGNTEAQFLLGLMYRDGDGVPQDGRQAANWLRRAADAGHIGAQYNYGYMLYAGLAGVREDETEGFRRIADAAERGYALAQVTGGRIRLYHSGGLKDPAAAVRFFRMAADQGNADGLFYLGLVHDFGYGIPQDQSKAVPLYATAAELGHIRAQAHLGISFEKGEGVAPDMAQALIWVRRAAEAGDPTGQNSLAVYYLNGRGVPVDLMEAMKFVLLSAAQGFDKAQANVPLIEARLTPSQVAEARRRQAAWKPSPPWKGKIDLAGRSAPATAPAAPTPVAKAPAVPPAQVPPAPTAAPSDDPARLLYQSGDENLAIRVEPAMTRDQVEAAIRALRIPARKGAGPGRK
jgi:TPR repeat protein